MLEIAIEILLLSGAFFAFVAAIGIVRLPDLFMRLSANAKAATLGTSLMLGGAGLYFRESAVWGKIAAIVAFLLLTAPVAAHMIGRAAYFSRVPLWKGTVCDELGGGEEGCRKDGKSSSAGSGEPLGKR